MRDSFLHRIQVDMERVLQIATENAERQGPKTPSPTSGGKARAAKLQRDRDDHSPIKILPPPPPPEDHQGATTDEGAAGTALRRQQPEKPLQGKDAAEGPRRT